MKRWMGWSLGALIALLIAGMFGCQMFSRNDQQGASSVTAPGASPADLTNAIFGDAQGNAWGAWYQAGAEFAMVNVPYAAAVRIRYGLATGPIFAILAYSETAYKVEIGLKTVDGQVDIVDWICVDYLENGRFTSLPAEARELAARPGVTHYQRRDDATGELSPWWLPDAAFVFSDYPQTICVVVGGVVQGAEVAGPFPKPSPVPPAPAPCTEGLLTYAGATHTVAECAAAGGTCYDTGATGTICRFTWWNCPVGWTQADHWQRYRANAEDPLVCDWSTMQIYQPTTFANQAGQKLTELRNVYVGMYINGCDSEAHADAVAGWRWGDVMWAENIVHYVEPYIATDDGPWEIGCQ